MPQVKTRCLRQTPELYAEQSKGRVVFGSCHLLKAIKKSIFSCIWEPLWLKLAVFAFLVVFRNDLHLIWVAFFEENVVNLLYFFVFFFWFCASRCSFSWSIPNRSYMLLRSGTWRLYMSIATEKNVDSVVFCLFNSSNANSELVLLCFWFCWH